jgi:putative ABC transport system substrate-binding protein
MCSMQRRRFLQQLAGLGLAGASLGLAACARAPDRSGADAPVAVTRVGMLWAGSRAGTIHLLSAFEQGLRELGYVDGVTISLEHRYANGQLDRVPALARELVNLRVAAIVAGCDVEALKAATDTIPIVMVWQADPIRAGYIQSYARPGGNVTGTTILLHELGPKRLELLKEMAPHVRRVAVLTTTDEGPAADAAELQETARTLGLQIRYHDVQPYAPGAERRMANVQREPLEAAVAAIKRAGDDALIVSYLAELLDNPYVARAARQERLPSIAAHRDYAGAGGLMAYFADIPALCRRAAGYVDKILKGAAPAELPVEQPTVFGLTVNRATAYLLDLPIPPSILARATEVI